MNDRDKKLLNYLSHNGPTSAMAMSKVLEVSHTTARVILERFTEQETVVKRVTRQGKKKRASFTLNTKRELFVLIKPEFKVRCGLKYNGW